MMPMVLAFQFTPLREGRQLLPGSVRQPYYFNSRPSARGDHGDGAVIANFVQFQFTPLREGRQGGCTRNHFFKIFQFTPLREGRPIWVLMDLQQANFNSRPSARGDDALQQAEAAGVISIHAPPRGATLTDVQRHVIEAISIHAPPRGATGFKREYGYYQLFQFTPLREGRRSVQAYWESIPHFNSRPSARGDGTRRVLGLLESHFNSRPSARGDAQRLAPTATTLYFNSRPSARGDRSRADALLTLGRDFNSRPSARGD